MQERYTIGEIAKKLQISTRTLRYYDEKDLVRPACIKENGYRLYDEEQVKQLELILFLKELGFSLKEIKMLIRDEYGAGSLELLLEQQYQENQRKIDEIRKKQNQIKYLQKIKLSNTSLSNLSNITNIMKKENKHKTLMERICLFSILLVLGELIAISILYAFKLRMGMIVTGTTLVGAVALSKYYYDCVEYVCPNCGDVFVPTFLKFNLAPHTPKFRKLTCPKCGKKSYCLEISRG